MSAEREYEIVLQPEPEGSINVFVNVFVAELPGVATQGETIKEATKMSKEAHRGLPRCDARGRPLHPDRPPQQRCSSHRVTAQLPAVSGGQG
jgi:hypothetical protein